MANKMLDAEINRLHGELLNCDPGEEKYAQIVKQLDVLYKIPKKDPIIKPEVLVNASVNLLGIVLVLYFEKFDIISSKAFSFIKKV